MTLSVNKRFPELNVQSGAVLFTSLIFLLLMTIIGVTSMRSTILEEKMASNTKNMNLALQAAEAALRAGEAQITAGIAAFDAACTDGYCSYAAGDETPRWKDSTLDVWNDADKHQQYSDFPDDIVASVPRFIIEKMPSSISQGSGGASLVVGFQPGQTGSTYYQVTGRGVGGAGEAVVLLQSFYRQ